MLRATVCPLARARVVLLRGAVARGRTYSSVFTTRSHAPSLYRALDECLFNTHLATGGAEVVPQLCILTTSYDLLAEDNLADVRRCIDDAEATVPQLLGLRALSSISDTHYVALTSVFQRLDGSIGGGGGGGSGAAAIRAGLSDAGAAETAPTAIFVHAGPSPGLHLREWLQGLHQGGSVCGSGDVVRPWVVASDASAVEDVRRQLTGEAEPWACAVPAPCDGARRFSGFTHSGAAGDAVFHQFAAAAAPGGSGSAEAVVVAFTTPWASSTSNQVEDGGGDDEFDEYDDDDDDAFHIEGAEPIDTSEFFDDDDDLEHPDESDLLPDNIAYGADLALQLFGDMSLQQQHGRSGGGDSDSESSETREGPAAAAAEALWLTPALADAVSPLQSALRAFHDDNTRAAAAAAAVDADHRADDGHDHDGHDDHDDHYGGFEDEEVRGEEHTADRADDWTQLENVQDLPPVLLVPLAAVAGATVPMAADGRGLDTAYTERGQGEAAQSKGEGEDEDVGGAQCVLRTGVDRGTDILLHRHIADGIPMVVPVGGRGSGGGGAAHDGSGGGGGEASRGALAWIRNFHPVEDVDGDGRDLTAGGVGALGGNAAATREDDEGERAAAGSGSNFDVVVELGREVLLTRAWTTPQSFGVRMAEISVPPTATPRGDAGDGVGRGRSRRRRR